MQWTIDYADEALEDLDRMDEDLRTRIIKKIETYCRAEKPMRFAKPLKGDLSGLFRFRIGHYRAVFKKEESGEIVVLEVLYIRHRRFAYKDSQ